MLPLDRLLKVVVDLLEIPKQDIDRQIAENAGVLGALRDGSELDGGQCG